MPFNQPATNNYFGFQPVAAIQGSIQITPYLVSATEASAIAIGDVVCQTSIGTVRAITGAYTPTSSMATVGVSASYIPAGSGSTAALITNSNSSSICLVYDGPNQQFVVCDTTSGCIGTQTGLYKNYSILATGCTGSTGINTVLGRSVMALSGVTATAAGAFKPLYLHPLEMGQFSSAAAGTAVVAAGVRKWIGVFEQAVTLQSTQLSAMQNTTS